jgi:hypothetical protein
MTVPTHKTHYCRVFGQPLDAAAQECSPRQAARLGRLAYLILTCRTPGCDLNDVTFTELSYYSMTDAELEPYRGMVRKLNNRT